MANSQKEQKMQVELFKKKSVYKNNNGVEKTAINFYVKCGEKLISVKLSYFGDDNNPDKEYAIRKALMEAFATELPKKEKVDIPTPDTTNSGDNLPFN